MTQGCEKASSSQTPLSIDLESATQIPQQESNEGWIDFIDWFEYYIVQPLQQFMCWILWVLGYELPPGCQ